MAASARIQHTPNLITFTVIAGYEPYGVPLRISDAPVRLGSCILPGFTAFKIPGAAQGGELGRP